MTQMSAYGMSDEMKRALQDIIDRLNRLERRAPQAVGGTGAGVSLEDHKTSHEEGGSDEIAGDDLQFDTPASPTGFDSTDITAESSAPDEDGVIHAWFIVVIPRVDAAADYILSYRKTGTTDFVHILVEQPASGDPEVKTHYVECNVVYYFKICARGKTGLCSSWTSEVTKTSLKDTAAPSTPTGLSATAVMNGILLEWNQVSAKDLSHYEVYQALFDDFGFAYIKAKVKSNYFLWKSDDTIYYDWGVVYFWVKAVDNSGNMSSETTSVNAAVLRVKPIDLSIETRTWVSDINFYFIDPDYDRIYWTKKALGNTDADIKFGDGTIEQINYGNVDSLASGVHYFYWDENYKTGGDYDIQHSTTYSDACGEGKGLLAVIQINTIVPYTPSILPFNCYLPTIGGGVIAGKSIMAQHLITDTAVITEQAQIGDNTIISDAIVQLEAAKVLIDGEIVLSNWRKTGDVTKIDGGYISAETVDAAQIKAHAITTSKLYFDILTSDPDPYIRTLWYRSDLDLLMFAGDTGEKGYIPRFPITQINAPPEQRLSNGSFEEDVDGDGLPDFWQYSSPTHPSRSTTYDKDGDYSMRFYTTSALTINLYSKPFSVKGDTDYFRSVWVRFVSGAQMVFTIHWYPTKTDAENFTNQISDNTIYCGTTTGAFYQRTDLNTSPTAARWARVQLWTWEAATNNYADLVEVSEQRAFISTQEVIAATNIVSPPQANWTADAWNDIATLTVPAVDHEILFIMGSFSFGATGAGNTYFRVKHGDDYYPNTTGVLTKNQANQAGYVFLTIPKNVAGDSITLQAKPNYAASNVLTAMSVWGHSPHKHQ